MSPKLRLIICNELADPKSQPAANLSVVEPFESAEEEMSQTAEPQRGAKLIPVLLGLFLALFFQILAHEVYDNADLRGKSWVDAVTWGLVATGATISLMQFINDCSACRLVQAVRIELLSTRLCRGCA